MGDIIYISDILEAYEEYKQNDDNQVLLQGFVLLLGEVGSMPTIPIKE